MGEIGYVECDGLSIAYRTTGDGPIDIVMVPGIFSHLELFHDFPQYTDFVNQLSEFARVIEFDKRGQGLSDRLTHAPTLEDRANDITALIENLNLKNCVLFGLSEGAAMALLYAAMHTDAVSKIITFGGYAKSCGAPDYPYMAPKPERSAAMEQALEQWGSGSSLGIFVPSLANVSAAQKLFGKIQRACCSPVAMRKYFELNLDIDVRFVLPSVQQPALVMHHSNDRQVPIENGAFLAEHLPNANFVDCGAGGHYFWGENNNAVVSQIRSFLTEGIAAPVKAERVLAAVLFTDIAGSTEKLRKQGDRAWRSVLDKHDELTRELVEMYRGRLVKLTGDGVLATFEGPGRAVECAAQMRKKLSHLGIEMRAGLHIGEIELRGDDVGGLAVHVASRIEGCCKANQILVSRTVADLTIGTNAFALKNAGNFELKGIEGTWELCEAIL
jgi:class 3 adenylate cyclase/pimeloyl-ACP methyl ester carboxylesterase